MMKFSTHTFFRTIFVVVLALFATSCSTTRADLSSNLLDDRQIFVRVINSTDYYIGRSLLGHQYIKPNSYSRTTYHTNFGKLPAGSVTRYKQVPNVTIGQSRFRMDDIGTERFYLSVDLLGKVEQLDPAYLSEVQWIHPYSKEIKTDLGLVEGKYTLELLSIVKDENGRNQMNAIATKDE